MKTESRGGSSDAVGRQDLPQRATGDPSALPTISMRDYFAAQAMSALIAKAGLYERRLGGLETPGFNEIPDAVSRGAYDYVDAMLKARNWRVGQVKR